MAEIDTTPIESVQAAISFFGEKDEQRKIRSINKDATHELDKEMEIETLMKDLTNLKAQLEAKDSAHKKTSDELSTQLKAYEAEKDALKNERQESRTRARELESAMASQSAECMNLREQLSSVLRELKDTQGQLLQLDIDLSASKDAEFEAKRKIEALNSSLMLEKIKNEELDRVKGELEQARNEIDEGREREDALETAISMLKSEIHKGRSKVASAEAAEERAKKEKSALYAALQQLAAEADEAKKACRISETTSNLSEESDVSGNEEAEKDSSSEKVVNPGLENTNPDTRIAVSKDDISILVSKDEEGETFQNPFLENSDQQAEQAKDDLNPGLENTNPDTRIAFSKDDITILAAKDEQEETFQIPSLEISDQRAEQAKNDLNPGLENTNPDTRIAVSKDDITILVAKDEHDETLEIPSLEISDQRAEEAKNDLNPGLEISETLITLSKDEYDVLVANAKQGIKTDHNPGQITISKADQDSTKKELENAALKIAEFRARAEQAISRAEVAERSRAALEEQVRKFREHKAKRKAALAALHEASVLKEIAGASSSKGANAYNRYDGGSKVYQPLSKILNMKF